MCYYQFNYSFTGAKMMLFLQGSNFKYINNEKNVDNFGLC